ncbi:MAG: pyridoxal phosphate-dependent aminotransferase [Bacteroidales bacterium]|jgi:aspartate/methionine/tyrosine aminotransferase|nr:pyridoxal phosphate-dependent aminotransferase [Bacteroidales bacterium]MDD3330682.1 pyridoxal phosphate-dependent aminotransferase [Bacteroidales bacterium]MDD3691239.1 pyridoxal phosphate-dependent aminotransferase [Bacteroidales bacterium]MDD4044944.1 pyridoxal phosphate-dependent aminotransferase [Bacteroidales bacterium]MDD4581925.1 pyridoxal phosphate-dependent aminotransferase [Bacteroidales bacterium]
MKDTPIPYEIVKQRIKESNLPSIGKASIREVKRLINEIEQASGKKFIRMEMGIPGLPAVTIGLEAQKKALDNGVAALYPDIDGIPELKKEMSRFCKNFLDIDVKPASCIPTVGSMQAGFATFLTFQHLQKGKDTTLFIDPGFPVQKQQHRILGAKFESFDVYDFRGDKLKDKLESYLKKGNIHSIIYSNPNNPSWICFTEKELRIIGELAKKYDAIVIEDLAYFGMDFRKDISSPGQPPYQATVAKYTDKYVLFISSSKAFSYAGERLGVMVLSDTLFQGQYPDLKPYFGTDNLGHAIVYGSVYALSSGTSHSAQYAMAAILKACNDGTYNFVQGMIEYRDKAHVMKKMFTDNGFKIVYDKDEDQALSDGFYFTISYPGYSGEELLEELLYYGISAISLAITGSQRLEGLRACVSLVPKSQFPELEERLKAFAKNHPL